MQKRFIADDVLLVYASAWQIWPGYIARFRTESDSGRISCTMFERVLSSLSRTARAKARCFWILCVIPLAAQEHAGQYSQADIERGSRIYSANCVPCHGPNGDLVHNVDLRSGKFRHAASEEDLGRVIAAGIPGTAMPPHKFDSSELSWIVAYVRSMAADASTAMPSGDSRRGEAVFRGKGGCLNCHRVSGLGSRLAPDLSEIGAVRTPERLRRSLLDPTAAMLPMHRSVRGVTPDGKVITGRRLNEDTYSVQVIDSEEHLVALMKADLREYKVIPASPMPSYRDKLTADELADLLTYLLSLRGGN
jgi:cytochrome c oxidase cbb3-type subunit III